MVGRSGWEGKMAKKWCLVVFFGLVVVGSGG